MRIISGYFKGKHIIPGKNFNARPTTDVAKEGLFNILNNHFDYSELKVLDLFSGTGSISYEFASRGVMDITSIELNFKNYAFIKKTIADLQFDQIISFRADAFKFLKMSNLTYDIIFADPPYELEGIETLPDIIFSKNLINKHGWFILEHNSDHNFSKHPNFKETRKYSLVHFSIFEPKVS
ncbi:MAG TPA: 16S rRNA (guanine(966)-N(2))-methyltransferase RsmD [Bacteroidales bacterium]|nr:MAG: 16S rRNA (guanine(966)-N(2))-methyltransferase RsmD [Bacteroidetes bacterium GWF2_33_38]OFY72871.1 MAG: 16S rRNA (guanine(966)-N(2))-methyltransferase RsmD [Bacteroidetes bacterium RIFOXYA12_FULL_33_9]OFY91933.1 MAG: 16S rRNA (guanine(966)-N(2))-methyltransferase RsmD [Bacteroidetes bacterium RIFOXYA2_FULL_33_7]HBF87045.1 16S rRNA (guanine(966)-N(2))-methyltransferase RsmD [Bacteroidales bacterium]